jgi:hypothetical protein
MPAGCAGISRTIWNGSPLSANAQDPLGIFLSPAQGALSHPSYAGTGGKDGEKRYRRA